MLKRNKYIAHKNTPLISSVIFNNVIIILKLRLKINSCLICRKIPILTHKIKSNIVKKLKVGLILK